jgi:hypothetical protein
MNKDNEYRENAAECERMARLTRDKTDKGTWLDMSRGSKARHTSRRQAVQIAPFVLLRVFEGRRGSAAESRLLLLLLQTMQERN